MLEPVRASPIFWVVDFSPWGWAPEATASALPLTKSVACSTYDFCESGLAAAPSWDELGMRDRTHLVTEGLAAEVRHCCDKLGVVVGGGVESRGGEEQQLSIRPLICASLSLQHDSAPQQRTQQVT